MYAVIKSGGKQHRVSVGDRLRVESLGVEPGQELELDQVLLVADGEDVAVGTPHVAGKEKKVMARVLGHGRGDKIRVFKLKRRKGYRRTIGHRQNYTELEIVSIAGQVGGGGKPKTKGAAKKRATKNTADTSAEAAGETAGDTPAAKD